VCTAHEHRGQAAAGHAALPDRRAGPTPLPRPSSLAPLVTRPPPHYAAIKASAADRRPFSPQRYFLLSKAAPSAPARPLYLLSTLANRSDAASPRIIAATTLSPLLVSTALEALLVKWP
jgi:hypothetical protein